MIYFITGVAGFIGSNLAKRILTEEKKRSSHRTRQHERIL